jgi:hypothetical protein
MVPRTSTREVVGMANCPNCSALLRPGADWCLNCLQSVATPTTATDPPEGAPTIARTQRTQRQGALRPELRPRPALKRAEYSRWKKGPTSFGPATKVVLTVIIVALAPLSGALGMQVLYLIGYLPIALLLLWGLWRKQQVG